MGCGIVLYFKPTDKSDGLSHIQPADGSTESLNLQLRASDGSSIEVGLIVPSDGREVTFYAHQSVEELDYLLGLNAEVVDGDKVICTGMIRSVFGHLGNPWKKIAEEQRRRRAEEN